MPSYHIWTIGCQMNMAESDRLAALLEKQGYNPVATPEEADMVVLNSCVVRGSAENKVLSKLGALRVLKETRPDMKVALTGCLVEPGDNNLKKRFPYVDYFFIAGGVPDWPGADGQTELPLPSVTAYVTIIKGCDNFCSYCIVPYRRGREKSRPLADIAAEVRALVENGTKEVTLLGQNVDSYGHDLPGQPDLADLLKELNGIDGLLRIRFLTNHPKDMSAKLIDAVVGLDKVCHWLNLPLQAGDDEVLGRMRRGYTATQYCQLVAGIRRKMPDVALITDVIVGFPGETELQFEQTYRMLTDIRFDAVHVAAYSTRTGTIAAKKYEDDISASEKKRRLAAVEALQEKIAIEKNDAMVGKRVEVLVEGRHKGKWQGRSRSGKLVFFKSEQSQPGELVNIVIKKAGPWSLQGEPVDGAVT